MAHDDDKRDIKLETVEDLLDEYYYERKWTEEAEEIDTHDLHYNRMYDIKEEIVRRTHDDE